MKKAALISMMITAVLFAVNLTLAHLTGWLIGLRFYGGECTERIGFGVRCTRFYPMLEAGESYNGPRYNVGIDFLSLLATLIIVFAVCSIVHFIRKLVSEKKNEDKNA